MSPQPASGFASTQWSLVLAAKNGHSPAAETAMGALCAAYWRPLYAFIRRRGYSVEDAQDLTQSFISHLLEKDSLRHVDPSLGKFRSFLLAALKNFLANEWRNARAWKRGGGARMISMEEMAAAEDHQAVALATPQTPEQVYERNWTLALLERTLARLAAEFSAAGKTAAFERLKPYLTGDGGASYSDVATALGMSEVAVRVSVHRMRGRFRDLLVSEVAQTMAPAGVQEIEEELRYLLRVL